MKRKTILYSFITIVIIIVSLGYIVLNEYNRKHKDVTDIPAAFTMNSDELIRIFSTDEKTANIKYLDKVIEVTGVVKSIDKDDNGSFTVVLGSQASMSSVRCSMDSSHNPEAANLISNKEIRIKGICTGFNADEMLGSDVILNRCAIKKNQ